MNAIYKRELNQYFKTPTGYIFISMFLFITGTYFYLVNLSAQNGDIKNLFSSIFPIILFLIPIITMRLFSEEKKQKTDELLFTSPISTKEIILGKFFSTLVVFLIPLAGTIMYPVILSFFTKPEVLVILGNYIGIILLSSSFISIGLFIAVIFENQILSAFVTYCMLMLFFIAKSISGATSNIIIKSVLSSLAITSRYEIFTYGVFNLINVIYYIGVTMFFIFLSIYFLEKKQIQ